MDEVDPAFMLRRIDDMPNEFVLELFTNWVRGKLDLTAAQADVVTVEVDLRFDQAINVTASPDPA